MQNVLMFAPVLIFIISLVVEILLLTFTSPDLNGSNNHLTIFSLSITSGFLVGSFYSLILVFIFYLIKAKKEIRTKSFQYRGIILGLIVTIILLTKFYEILDKFITIFLLFIFISFEIILSKRE